MDKETLLKENEILKTEYIKLLNDKDILINWGKPHLEALYISRLGKHQLSLLQMQLNIQALKRKIELIHAAINTQQQFDIIDIELTIALELHKLELAIIEQTNSVNNAVELLSNLDTPQRSAEIKQVFKNLAKQLHPDVNIDLSDTQIELWHKVKNAYEYGDLEQLKALEIIYEEELNNIKKHTQERSVEEISLQNNVLKEGSKILYNQIAEIKMQYPFTIEEQIKDDEWVANEVSKIQEQILQLKNYEAELEHQLNLLLNLN